MPLTLFPKWALLWPLLALSGCALGRPVATPLGWMRDLDPPLPRHAALTGQLDDADEQAFRAFTAVVDQPTTARQVFGDMDYWIRQYGPGEHGWFVLVLSVSRCPHVVPAFGPGVRDLDPERLRFLLCSLLQSVDLALPREQLERVRSQLMRIERHLDATPALERASRKRQNVEQSLLAAVHDLLHLGYFEVRRWRDEATGREALLVPYTLNAEWMETARARTAAGR